MIYKNLAYGLVTTAPSPATSGTSLVLGSGEGARFPQPSTDGSFYVTIFPVAADPTPATAEIVLVTARSIDTLTIVRAQKSTSARTVIVGDRVIQGIYAEDIGLTSIVRNETPGGSINSSNTAFTTAVGFQTGSLEVYQNGVRLKGGGVDYTEGASAFTMIVAPATNDVLIVDYLTNSNAMAIGTNSFVSNETPSGTVNSSNQTFTLAQTPVSGTLQLYRDGQLMTGGGADYTLTTNSIAFVTAPITGSVLLAFYQFAVAASANADTVDGYNVNATPTANNIPVLDANANLPYRDGWTPATGSWTYASASTITVPSGAAAIYQKGDRIKWTQTTVKYGVIVAVADTLLTIAVNTDYVVTNAAISAIYYSHQANPLGYPTWFAYTPTWGGSTTNPVLNNGTLVSKVKVDGSTMTVKFELFCGASTTYGTGNYYFTLPVNPANSRQDVGSSWFLNGGTARIGVSIYNFQGASGVEFVSSTNSSVGNTSPATWASGDRLNAFFTYQF